MWEYPLWVVSAVLMAGLATYFSITLWERALGREESLAGRLLDKRDAEAGRRAEAERRIEAERHVAEVVATSERRLRCLAEAGAIALWHADADGRITLSEGWSAITGQPDDAVIGTKDGWLAVLHDDDRAAVAAAWAAALASGHKYEAEYRLPTQDGGWRWCRGRGVAVRAEPGQAMPEGRVLEWVGLVEDIDARRRSEEARMLLAQEVNHRAKNLLTVSQSIVRMTPSLDAEATGTILARLAALARSNDLLAEREWRGADLRDVAARALAPYQGCNAQGSAAQGRTAQGRTAQPNVGLDGPPIALTRSAVQPLAMLLHEMATNAAKYGSLSAGGSVVLHWHVDATTLYLRWTETGGPPVMQQPTRSSFGTRVINTTVRNQLGGSMERQWLPSGLVCEIALPKARVIRSDAD